MSDRGDEWREKYYRAEDARNNLAIQNYRLRSATNLALVMARDYLLWLVECKGVKLGAVSAVRKQIDKALSENGSSGHAVLVSRHHLPCHSGSDAKSAKMSASE